VKNKLLFVVIISLLLTGCSEERQDNMPESTILTVRLKLRDDPNPPRGTVYVWDASSNDFPDELSILDGLKFGTAKDVNGKEVRSIKMEALQENSSPNGSSSDYRFAIFNLDNILFYDKASPSGKLLVLIMIDETDKYAYKIIDWVRARGMLIEKTFDSKYPRFSHEEWAENLQMH
jgi:hypothetical protein